MKNIGLIFWSILEQKGSEKLMLKVFVLLHKVFSDKQALLAISSQM